MGPTTKPVTVGGWYEEQDGEVAVVIQRANDMIDALETEQQHGGPIRRRMLDTERCELIATRDRRLQTLRWEEAIEKLRNDRSNQGASQRDSLLKQLEHKGCSATKLAARVAEAQRVLGMYPRPEALA
jgi:hypothetical protein